MNQSDLPISLPRAWVEIDIAALLKNLAFARDVSSCAMMAIVKAGAYGHGLDEIAVALAGAGVEFLGVANIGEARRIAKLGSQRGFIYSVRLGKANVRKS